MKFLVEITNMLFDTMPSSWRIGFFIVALCARDIHSHIIDRSFHTLIHTLLRYADTLPFLQALTLIGLV